jgi:hypothetical protein
MNDIKNDKNLREAVNRREQQQPPMPADLNEQLQQRLFSPKESPFCSLSSSFWGKRPIGPSGRVRGVSLLLAAAASIALLIVFYFGKQQRPQEPVVAQTNEKVSPLQPPPEGEAPPLREGAGGEAEQPEGKPVTELSEDTPQPAEQTSTENVKAPRHFNSQRILDITSFPNSVRLPVAFHEDEPFFLASTSYMVTHRSYRDGLVDINATDDSDDDGLNLHSVKDEGEMPEGWTELRNWSNSQNVRRNLTKKEKTQVAVAGAIAARQWHIEISSMTTMRYGSRTVTPDFYLELRGDTLRSYLPYLGQAQVSPTLSPSIGLNFEEPVLSYNDSKPKSNKYTQIDIDVRTREDSYHYVIEIYDNGQAYIRVRSMNRDPISFDGKLEIE